MQQLAATRAEQLTADGLAAAAILLKHSATFPTPLQAPPLLPLPLHPTACDALQPVLEEVSHRVCCGLFKEYSHKWEQQQQRHHHRELDLRSMNPYFLERAQVPSDSKRASASCAAWLMDDI
jgi:hypothetical protein